MSFKSLWYSLSHTFLSPALYMAHKPGNHSQRTHLWIYLPASDHWATRSTFWICETLKGPPGASYRVWAQEWDGLNELCETAAVEVFLNKVIGWMSAHSCTRKLFEEFSVFSTKSHPSPSVIWWAIRNFIAFLRITIQQLGSWLLNPGFLQKDHPVSNYCLFSAQVISVFSIIWI